MFLEALFAIDIGVEIGVNLPASAKTELNAGKPWSKTTGAGTQPGSWGGLCVLVTAYDANGLTCVTWGRKQSMTWRWFKKYCDEAYAVFDAADSAKSPVIVARRVEEFVSGLA